jgi:cell division septation protein DedD
MMSDKNAAQELADDMLTNPDKDAAEVPLPPQTIDAEPTSGRPGQVRVEEDDDD